MQLDLKRLAFAAMVVWAVWYTICAFFVAVAPAELQAVLSWALHYDLNVPRTISWSSWFGGVIATSIWVGLFVACIGWAFRGLGGSGAERLPAGQGLAPHAR